MKILQNSNYLNLKSATNLTPHCSAPILKADENTYVFCDEDAQRPYLVIQSTIFGLLMKRLEDRIIHYNVYRPRCLCCDGEGDLTIRLTEIDGFIYQIDESDNIEMCLDLERAYNGEYEKN